MFICVNPDRRPLLVGVQVGPLRLNDQVFQTMNEILQFTFRAVTILGQPKSNQAHQTHLPQMIVLQPTFPFSFLHLWQHFLENSTFEIAGKYV